MADPRTLRAKLRAMAEDASSPHEAAIARARLEALGPEPGDPDEAISPFEPEDDENVIMMTFFHWPERKGRVPGPFDG